MPIGSIFKKSLHLGSKRTRIRFDVFVKDITFSKNEYFVDNSTYSVFFEGEGAPITARDECSNVQDISRVRVRQTLSLTASLFQNPDDARFGDFQAKEKKLIVRQTTRHLNPKKEPIYVDVGYITLRLDKLALGAPKQDHKLEIFDPYIKGKISLTISYMHMDTKGGGGDAAAEDDGRLSAAAGSGLIRSKSAGTPRSAHPQKSNSKAASSASLSAPGSPVSSRSKSAKMSSSSSSSSSPSPKKLCSSPHSSVSSNSIKSSNHSSFGRGPRKDMVIDAKQAQAQLAEHLQQKKKKQQQQQLVTTTSPSSHRTAAAPAAAGLKKVVQNDDRNASTSLLDPEDKHQRAIELLNAVSMDEEDPSSHGASRGFVNNNSSSGNNSNDNSNNNSANTSRRSSKRGNSLRGMAILLLTGGKDNGFGAGPGSSSSSSATTTGGGSRSKERSSSAGIVASPPAERRSNGSLQLTTLGSISETKRLSGDKSYVTAATTAAAGTPPMHSSVHAANTTNSFGTKTPYLESAALSGFFPALVDSPPHPPHPQHHPHSDHDHNAHHYSAAAGNRLATSEGGGGEGIQEHEYAQQDLWLPDAQQSNSMDSLEYTDHTVASPPSAPSPTTPAAAVVPSSGAVMVGKTQDAIDSPPADDRQDRPTEEKQHQRLDVSDDSIKLKGMASAMAASIAPSFTAAAAAAASQEMREQYGLMNYACSSGEEVDDNVDDEVPEVELVGVSSRSSATGGDGPISGAPSQPPSCADAAAYSMIRGAGEEGGGSGAVRRHVRSDSGVPTMETLFEVDGEADGGGGGGYSLGGRGAKEKVEGVSDSKDSDGESDNNNRVFFNSITGGIREHTSAGSGSHTNSVAEQRVVVEREEKKKDEEEKEMEEDPLAAERHELMSMKNGVSTSDNRDNSDKNINPVKIGMGIGQNLTHRTPRRGKKSRSSSSSSGEKDLFDNEAAETEGTRKYRVDAQGIRDGGGEEEGEKAKKESFLKSFTSFLTRSSSKGSTMSPPSAKKSPSSSLSPYFSSSPPSFSSLSSVLNIDTALLQDLTAVVHSQKVPFESGRVIGLGDQPAVWVYALTAEGEDPLTAFAPATAAASAAAFAATLTAATSLNNDNNSVECSSSSSNVTSLSASLSASAPVTPRAPFASKGGSISGMLSSTISGRSTSFTASQETVVAEFDDGGIVDEHASADAAAAGAAAIVLGGNRSNGGSRNNSNRNSLNKKKNNSSSSSNANANNVNNGTKSRPLSRYFFKSSSASPTSSSSSNTVVMPSHSAASSACASESVDLTTTNTSGNASINANANGNADIGGRNRMSVSAHSATIVALAAAESEIASLKHQLREFHTLLGIVVSDRDSIEAGRIEKTIQNANMSDVIDSLDEEILGLRRENQRLLEGKEAIAEDRNEKEMKLRSVLSFIQEKISAGEFHLGSGGGGGSSSGAEDVSSLLFDMDTHYSSAGSGGGVAGNHYNGAADHGIASGSSRPTSPQTSPTVLSMRGTSFSGSSLHSNYNNTSSTSRFSINESSGAINMGGGNFGSNVAAADNSRPPIYRQNTLSPRLQHSLSGSHFTFEPTTQGGGGGDAGVSSRSLDDEQTVVSQSSQNTRHSQQSHSTATTSQHHRHLRRIVLDPQQAAAYENNNNNNNNNNSSNNNNNNNSDIVSGSQPLQQIGRQTSPPPMNFLSSRSNSYRSEHSSHTHSTSQRSMGAYSESNATATTAAANSSYGNNSSGNSGISSTMDRRFSPHQLNTRSMSDGEMRYRPHFSPSSSSSFNSSSASPATGTGAAVMPSAYSLAHQSSVGNISSGSNRGSISAISAQLERMPSQYAQIPRPDILASQAALFERSKSLREGNHQPNGSAPSVAGVTASSSLSSPSSPTASFGSASSSSFSIPHATAAAADLPAFARPSAYSIYSQNYLNSPTYSSTISSSAGVSAGGHGLRSGYASNANTPTNMSRGGGGGGAFFGDSSYPAAANSSATAAAAAAYGSSVQYSMPPHPTGDSDGAHGGGGGIYVAVPHPSNQHYYPPYPLYHNQPQPSAHKHQQQLSPTPSVSSNGFQSGNLRADGHGYRVVYDEPPAALGGNGGR